MIGDEFPVPAQCGSVNCSQEFFVQTKTCFIYLWFFYCSWSQKHVIALTNQNIGYITYMMEMDTLQFLTKQDRKSVV